MLQAKYLLLGDTHGSLGTAIRAIAAAKAARVDTIIQLGDFGFCWPGKNQLDALHQILDDAAVRMLFIDGNHDWHAGLDAVIWHRYPWLRYLRRGTVETFGDVRVGCLGGAASIDQDRRFEGHGWWATERISGEDVARLGPCDVLLTHDAPALPACVPPWPRPISVAVGMQIDLGREMIRRAIDRTGATRLYHGHYHCAYSATVGGVAVQGLAANEQRGARLLVDKRFLPCL